MAGAADVFRLVHPGRRTALDSRRRDDSRIRGPAHGRDAELPAGEFAKTVREISDAGAAGACVRGDGGRGLTRFLTLPWRGRVDAKRRGGVTVSPHPTAPEWRDHPTPSRIALSRDAR